MAEFKDLMNGFGIVTVMNAKIYKLSGASYTGSGAPVVLSKDSFAPAVAYLDTLKIANLNLEGPNKTVSGGQYNNPLIKWGKTGTIEIQEALGSKDIFEHFYAAEFSGSTDGIFVGSKFAAPFAIEGESFFVDQETGSEVKVYIFIPQVLPDSIFNLVQDAEGDATVFDLNGSVNLTTIDAGEKDEQEKPIYRKIFYRISEDSFFSSGS